MMALGTSAEFNENYAAKVVVLKNPIKHPNADKLQGWIIEGNRVWTDMSRKEGDVCVFFPLECKINESLLKGLNLYDIKDLNLDNTKKGFFNKHGRVRAIKLRGEPSEGFLLKVDEIGNVFGGDSKDRWNDVIGIDFDMWNDIKICEKYIPKVVNNEPREKGATVKQNRVRRFNKIINGQFNLHEKTSQLRKNIHSINPDDMISITYKLHGTSFVVGKVNTRRKLSWKERLFKWLGNLVVQTEYDIIYSSRNVIKNKYLNEKVTDGYYGHDLWADIKDVLQPHLDKGITIYGEAVGYTRTGKIIQKGYPYGYVAPEDVFIPELIGREQIPYGKEAYEEGKHFGVYVYRITQTNVDGKVYEFSWSDIKQFCNRNGIKHVPELYYGKADDWHDNVKSNVWNAYPTEWNEVLLDTLTQEYLEKDCFMHPKKDKVPAEGIVLRIDDLYTFKGYKHKSFRFLEHETKLLDEGEVDIETEESIEQE